MPSQALKDLEERMSEIDQLLEAHSALTGFHRAQAMIEEGPKDLQEAVEAIRHLVSAPSRGRPREVRALNKSVIALLSAHLQGFIDDIFAESTEILLAGKVEDVDSIIDRASRWGNPSKANIERLFRSIGFPHVISGISWQKSSNETVVRRLRELNELRNRIVHGGVESVTKRKAKGYATFVRQFAPRFDSKLADLIKGVTGQEPW